MGSQLISSPYQMRINPQRSHAFLIHAARCMKPCSINYGHHLHHDPLLARKLGAANIGGIRPSLVLPNPNTSNNYTASSSSSTTTFICSSSLQTQELRYEREDSPSGLAIIPFLHDMNIFITGATGFIAKGYDSLLHQSHHYQCPKSLLAML